MKRIGAVLTGTLLLGMLDVGSAYAAKGLITTINNPDKHGKIQEDGSSDKAPWNFRIPEDLDDPSYVPQVGDRVTFTRGRGRRVTNVAKEQALPACSLKADPISIPAGESATLSYTTTNADSVSIDQGIGEVTIPEGTVGVTLQASTTYTITATNAAGSCTASVTVVVT